jgi:hypothetical protein
VPAAATAAAARLERLLTAHDETENGHGAKHQPAWDVPPLDDVAATGTRRERLAELLRHPVLLARHHADLLPLYRWRCDVLHAWATTPPVGLASRGATSQPGLTKLGTTVRWLAACVYAQAVQALAVADRAAAVNDGVCSLDTAIGLQALPDRHAAPSLDVLVSPLLAAARNGCASAVPLLKFCTSAAAPGTIRLPASPLLTALVQVLVLQLYPVAEIGSPPPAATWVQLLEAPGSRHAQVALSQSADLHAAMRTAFASHPVLSYLVVLSTLDHCPLAKVAQWYRAPTKPRRVYAPVNLNQPVTRDLVVALRRRTYRHPPSLGVPGTTTPPAGPSPEEARLAAMALPWDTMAQRQRPASASSTLGTHVAAGLARAWAVCLRHMAYVPFAPPRSPALDDTTTSPAPANHRPVPVSVCLQCSTINRVLRFRCGTPRKRVHAHTFYTDAVSNTTVCTRCMSSVAHVDLAAGSLQVPLPAAPKFAALPAEAAIVTACQTCRVIVYAPQHGPVLACDKCTPATPPLVVRCVVDNAIIHAAHASCIVAHTGPGTAMGICYNHCHQYHWLRNTRLVGAMPCSFLLTNPLRPFFSCGLVVRW